MHPSKAILLAMTFSLILAPAAYAQAGYAQAQQMMIQAQREAEAQKAKEEADQKAKDAQAQPAAAGGTTDGGTSSVTPTGSGDNSGTPTNAGGDGKQGAKPDDKKTDDKKGDDKKADGDKKADADTKEADKKAADEKKAEADQKKEEDKRAAAAADKKLLESKETYNPMRDAIFAMQTGKYSDSLNLLNQVLSKNKNDLQARYLLGVTYVMLRRYGDATAAYKQVMSSAPANSQLAKLAAEGLSKIAK